jgi:hypothetical protein
MSTRTRSRTGTGILVAAIALGAAACTAGGAATASPVAPPTATVAPTTVATPVPGTNAVPDITPKPGVSRVPGLPGSPDPGEGEGVPPDVIQAAVDDAATRAGVGASEVTVVSAASMTWPNGALGCPKRGVMYTQALTPGYRVVVEAGGTRYDYRASQAGGDVRWCENPPGPG